MKRLLIYLFLVPFASTFSTSSSSDSMWTFFHPEVVTTMNCTIEEVQKVQVDQNGGPTGNKSETVWMAEARASRSIKELGDWGLTLGYFQLTEKGRHQAEKVCSRWMDEASRRVKAAAPIRVKSKNDR